MKKFCAAAMALSMLMSFWLPTSAMGFSLEQSETTTSPQTRTLVNVDTDAVEKEAASNSLEKNYNGDDLLHLSDVLSTNNYKQNIFNGILNSVDYYDAVEGDMLTTLWREDGEQTLVSYGSDIIAQKSYQKIIAAEDNYQVFVTDGKKYTFDETKRTSKIENIIGLEDEVDSRIKQTGNIYSAVAGNAREKAARVGVKEGVPIYYYRNDLTNCDYASVSIFPQTLAFGLLANYNDWDVVNTVTYLGREAIIVSGSISDKIYSQKINSETFELVIDVETGIVLEFTGYDNSGNETETIKTTDISITKNAIEKNTGVAAYVDTSLNKRGYYDVIKRENTLDADYIERSAVSTTSISNTIDNDTADSDCYNSRSGFLAYLNDSNYYNRDMRRTDSSSGTHYYGWHSDTVLDHEATDYIRVNLDIYLYSSTSKDPAASYGVYTVGMVADSVFGMCTMNQATAPNGWNSYSKRWSLGNAGYITGIEMSPSGQGSTYTGADAISYTISIA